MAIGPGRSGFQFNAAGVLYAPHVPGVYAIFNAQRYVFFGESNDLQRRLAEHLNDRTHAMHRYGAASFSFELINDPAQRLLRQNQLIQAHPTPCNQRLGVAPAPPLPPVR
jgi:excinuclease UvrABC nuclease subunit